MQFLIHVLDKRGGTAQRAELYDRHTAHLADPGRYGVTIISTGRLVADDGSTPIGNLLLVEAPDRASVEAFNGADPFTTGGVREMATISRFVHLRGASLNPA